MQWNETFSIQGITTKFSNLTDKDLRILARFIVRRVRKERLAAHAKPLQAMAQAGATKGGQNERIN